MRLSKVKLAGFKSFVDPTTIALPNNLTGVVGPNGCGKSNVIDAVRWVMGELSAKHLRGDSMADVVFNGSSTRKPLGTASVELLFDNGDGKIGGAYAAFSEISLKRVVSRDGSSGYYINGGRCRRKDITQLFLGTGLGSRSYAIIEQGMISRVIEARADDMRAFLEEAAGISLYKERRRETEARIVDTRENLARVQDLRDEIDKQIRHLQRQATAARKYQELRTRERLLTAELLALKLRQIDSGAEVNDGAMRTAELAMQQHLADQRSAEAAIEKQRGYSVELAEVLSKVQGQYYELGAEVTRTEENIRYTAELRTRQQDDLVQTTESLRLVAAQLGNDETRLAELQTELAQLTPETDALRDTEKSHLLAQSTSEAQLAEWQSWWEQFNSELGGASQTTQVEIARIEQLDAQLLRLRAHADRLLVERDTLSSEHADSPLDALQSSEAQARAQAEQHAQLLADVHGSVQELRTQRHAAESELESLRSRRERSQAELMSLEAVQKAALGEKDARASAWLEALPGGPRSRVAEQLNVDAGWERAVETVLGDYLEAVCVDDFESLQTQLEQLGGGSVSFVESRGSDSVAVAGTLATRVRGASAVLERLSEVTTAGSLAEALRLRSGLRVGQSVVTANGEWVGRGWLRVRRGGDSRSGLLEREQRLKQLRGTTQDADRELQRSTDALEQIRARLTAAEQRRDESQQAQQRSHQDHGELRSRLDIQRARIEAADQRRARIAAEHQDVEDDTARAHAGLSAARTAHAAALEALQNLDSRRPELEQERELRREAVNLARSRTQQSQLALRDALVKLESRRTAESSVLSALQRLSSQRDEQQQRHESLETALASGDQPIRDLQLRLDEALARRLDVEGELGTARQNLDAADSELRTLDVTRLQAEQLVTQARSALEAARLAAQESRLRRESLLEQFATTRHDLTEIQNALLPEASVEERETAISSTLADIEQLGQVNLAAIDELKEQGERKQYLDRQFADVNSALQTLEEAMRKIETETRSRFEDTFNRVNAGLQDKFPRLFGGGHAYLTIDGDNPLTGGVTIMARPPGKRNATISQLSGGEKALTAVALVFSIFDLNPAPFCLLDEVDAPLDEHNVGRFCDIVKEMSSRVQFIFITHNKVTMELASQLIGVTMNEPGVSRLVAVDIDEAVRMAAV
jgi:chromosome segregation protein